MHAGHHAVIASVVILTSSGSHSLVAQSTPASEFEVASIKLNTDARPAFNAVDRTFMRLTASDASNGRYTMRGFGAPTVGVLIQAAHKVKAFQVVGAPGWVNTSDTTWTRERRVQTSRLPTADRVRRGFRSSPLSRNN